MKYLLFLFLSLSLSAEARLVEKLIEYKSGGQTLEGYLVYNSSTKNKSGILVVHDWMGLTQKTKERAKEIARLGFVAFAADIYGKGIRPTTPEEAGKLATIYKTDRNLYRERLKASLEQLKAVEGVNDAKLGAIGYCFGGTGVIELARAGGEVKAVVSFHGSLDSPSPADGKNIQAKVLALHGADDPYVATKDLSAFEKEMADNKIDWQLIKYGGAVHSFTDKSAGVDNSKGAAYNEKADKRSWLAMKDFLNETL